MRSLSDEAYRDLQERWTSPETAQTLQRHMTQYFRRGIIESYVRGANCIYPPSCDQYYAKLQELIGSLVRAEMYLAATEYAMEGPGKDHYYLERVNDETGFAATALDDHDTYDSMVPVLVNDADGYQLKQPFTEDQALVVVENTRELQAMGLFRPLYPTDLR